MKHRSEIDGLRAIAVIPVILFHAGFELFSGGYVGVDIFFVISGYLITRILLDEIERGDFSILRFYERRARRILPALFVVMAACIPFAWMWMMPDQLRDFGRSVVTVVLFVSNFLFWREEGGYFAAAAELKPLLHTWSLAVEEQYYLFAPLTLAFMWRYGRRVVFWTTVALAIASLLLTEWGWRYAPVANFYLTPFRIWELLAGSICAFLAAGRLPRPSNALSALGLALIVFAIFRFDSSTPFPSLYGLIPVGGTVLIVMFARQGTLVARLLSTRPLVGIGLISYSAYLWHQPLFAFARLRSMAAPPEGLMLALAALSLVLAYVSWRFVEQPFRKGARKGVPPLLPARRAVFAASAGVGLVLAAAGAYGSVSGGAPWRLPQPAPGSRAEALLATLRNQPMGTRCWLLKGITEVGDRPVLCPIFEPENPQGRLLVVGDSHSMALLPAFEELGRRYAVDWAGAGSCPPLLGVTIRPVVFPVGVCEEVARRELQAAREGNFDVVVLAARWSTYAAGPPKRVVLFPEGNLSADPAKAPEVFARQLAETVRAYRATGASVVLVDQVPEQPAMPDKLLRQALLFGLGGASDDRLEEIIRHSSPTVEADREIQAYTEGVLKGLAGDNVWYLSLDDRFRRGDLYVWGDRDGSYYGDFNHMSLYGTRLVEPAVTALIDEVEKSRQIARQ